MSLSGYCGSMAEKLNNLLAASANPRDITKAHSAQGGEAEALRRALGGTILYKDGTFEEDSGCGVVRTVQHVLLLHRPPFPLRCGNTLVRGVVI